MPTRRQPTRSCNVFGTQSQNATYGTQSHRTRSNAQPEASQQRAQELVLRPLTTRTQKTATVTEQAITLQQSTEIVQTLVHGCVSSLAFLRNLFNDKCYDIRYYSEINSHWSYEDYASGKHRVDPEVARKNYAGRTVRALKRGTNSQADILLDWLEKAAFVALRRGYLHSMHISIFEDPDRPTDILELYTFTFDYANPTRDSNRRVVSGFEMTEHRGNKVTLKQARNSLNEFVTKLISLCYTMPALPSKRFLSMDLTYTNERPNDYTPPGFSRTMVDIVNFPEDDRWEKCDANCAKMDAGFHSVALKVCHLRAVNPPVSGDEESYDVDKIISNFAYINSTRKLDNIETDFAVPTRPRRTSRMLLPRSKSHTDGGVEKVITQSSKAHPTQNPRPSLRGPTPANLSPETTVDATEMDLDLSNSPNSNPVVPQRGVSSSRATTHPMKDVSLLGSDKNATTLGDIQERNKLRDMLQHSSPPEDTQATQVQVDSAHETLLSQCNFGSRIQLSQARIEEMDLTRSNQLPPRKKTLVIRTESSYTDRSGIGDVIHCQCGFEEDEGVMIQCDFCNTWQHLHCYGYYGNNVSRAPEPHACYRCLLHCEEIEELKKLQGLAWYRRALHLLSEQDFESEKQFGRSLDCGAQDTMKLVKTLRDQGLLAPNHGPKKSKVAHKIALNKAEDALKRMMTIYFEPTTVIAHHLTLPSSLGTSFEPTPTTEGNLVESMNEMDLPPSRYSKKRPRKQQHSEDFVPVKKMFLGHRSDLSLNVGDRSSPISHRSSIGLL